MKSPGAFLTWRQFVTAMASAGPRLCRLALLGGWGISLLSRPPSAAAQQCGDFTYTVNGGAATITGYTGSGGTVIIPSAINGVPVTAIGANAFFSCQALTNVSIPNSVTNVMSEAFCYCFNLASVNIPTNLAVLGDSAFYQCSSLLALHIPASVTKIGSSAFARCTSVTAISVDVLNPAYSSCGGVVFDKAQTLLVQYPGGLAGSYTVPAGVTAIAECAFQCSTGLTAVSLPKSLVSLGESAFDGCASLASVSLSTSGSQLASIGAGAFSGCTALLSLTLPGTLTNLGGGAFHGCMALTSVAVPGSVATLNYGVFQGCSGLTSLTLSEGTTFIDGAAFADCTSLPAIYLPSTVTNLGENPFFRSSRLADIEVDPLNPVFSSLGGVLLDRSRTTLLAFPTGLTNDYAVPAGVTTIGRGAFMYCASLTNLTFPTSVTKIQQEAFQCCLSLTNLTLPPNLTSIGVAAFDDCTSLSSITLPGRITEIPYELFCSCQSLANIVIPNGVTDIDLCAFNFSSVTNLTFPDSVSNLGLGVCCSCPNLTNVLFGAGLSSIGDQAFEYCSALQSLCFLGNAPTLGGANVFPPPGNAIVYYLPGTTGWGSTFGGLPTATWKGIPPTITQSPQNVAATAGTTATFTVSAIGTSLAYSWWLNGAPLPGATNSCCTLANVQTPNQGVYWVVITNALGAVTSAPAQLTVEFPHAATATGLIISGFFVQATVTDGGWGYTNTPSVQLLGGGGSGADAVAIVSNGVVVAIDILDAGFGYTNAPQIVIAAPYIPPPTLSISPWSCLTFTNLTPGVNYQLQFLHGSTWVDQNTAFAATDSTFTQTLAGAAAPSAWRLAVTPVPVQAQATPTLYNGFVVGAVVTVPGSGYVNAPMVSIVSQGAGSNAMAVATIGGGAVTGITIVRAGNGYTIVPSIVIAPPPVNALWPTVTQVMQLNAGGLTPNDNYQVQFAPAVTGPWSNLGDPFAALLTTWTQYFIVAGDTGFFRLEQVP